MVFINGYKSSGISKQSNIYVQRSIFAKIVNGYKSLNIFTKSSIVDVQLDSKYVSVKITLHLTFFRETKFMESWWFFLRSYLKKNKILSVSVKDKLYNSPEGLQLKMRLQVIFLCIFQNLQGFHFYRTTLVAAFEVIFSIRK